MKRNYLGIIDAAYAQITSDDAWVQGVADAARPVIDAGLGVTVYSYDASDPTRLTLDSLADAGAPQGWREVAKAAVTALPPEAVRVFYGGDPPVTMMSTLQRRVAPLPDPGTQRLGELGMQDALGIRGHNPSGHGLLVTAALPAPMRLASRRKAALDRVAAHLASAWRLRRAGQRVVRPDEAEAVLEPSGKVAHATEDLRGKGRLMPLVDALKSRGALESLRSEEPERALELWQALVAGRWSLIDHEERGGRRYVLACKNTPAVRSPLSLNPTESAVLIYASWGHSNQLISYELGLAPSTVSEMLKSALRKLRIGSRAELIKLFNSSSEDERLAR